MKTAIRNPVVKVAARKDPIISSGASLLVEKRTSQRRTLPTVKKSSAAKSGTAERLNDETLDDSMVNGNGLDLSSLQTLLGFHIRMAQAIMGRGFLEALADFSLTQKQHAIMLLLRDNPGTPQTQLASQLVTDRATMIAIIDRLQERGLLTRERSVVDRRRQDLYLTQAGLDIVRESAKVGQAHERQFEKKFTDAERGLFIEFLIRLYN